MLAIQRCRDVTMMCLRQDIYVGRSLNEYGEYPRVRSTCFANAWARASDKAEALVAQLQDDGYRIWWHAAAVQPGQFPRQSAERVWQHYLVACGAR